jgi:alcohol dehydrogenase class IV
MAICMIIPARSVMQNFEFGTSARILFGNGTIREIGPIAAAFGQRALLASGAPDAETDSILTFLRAAGVTADQYRVAGEPNLESILGATQQARQAKCQVIIGLGGGSAMDTAKAVAALAANPGDPLDYLEVAGKGLPLARPALPCIAAPTTAGTGAEVTRNAVIGIPEQKIKVSLRSPWILPKAAIIDPMLTRSLPPVETAYTGMDALTQVLEPFVCARTNPLTDGFCRDGLLRAGRSLRRAYADGGDLQAREEMSLTSLYGGLALANAGLGAVHGFAAPLGGLLPAPHGALCARLLPAVMSANIRALRARAAESPALIRYAEAARLLGGQADATPEDGVVWVLRLVESLHIPRLQAWGLTEADMPTVMEKASRASSMKANPILLTPDELRGILEEVQ